MDCAVDATRPKMIGQERVVRVAKSIALQIRKAACGPTLILGDFNARHKEQDTSSNQNGRALLAWCAKHDWKTRTPNSPPCITEQSRNALDIALTNSLEISKPHVCYGI